jgi:aminoacyl tRNA synthase complex-interacting multifunctional protein 1
LTAADVAVYGALRPTFVCTLHNLKGAPISELCSLKAQLKPAQYHTHPALTRYFDHIQSRPSVRKSAEVLAPAFDLIPLDFSAAPPIERKALEAKKKEKPAKTAENDATPPSSQNVAAAKKVENSEVKPSKKKEKQQSTAVEKEGKKKAADSGKAASGAGAEEVGPPIPSMIDLRVGHILEGASLH